MTLLDDPPVMATVPRRRLWSRPLGFHVAALAVVLLALVPVVGTSASFSTDEGAAIVQARSLARGDGWVVEHPFPEVDPDGRHYPLELSERGPRGFVAFGKHPLYALLMAGADRVGGVTAMVLVSLAGTVTAAGLAALLARRLGAGLDRLTLWVVGLASPLLFDGFLVMGHALGAALAAGAVLAAVLALERRRPAAALAVAPLVAGAVLVRSEGVFLALALAVAAGVLALWPPRRLVAAIVAGGALLAGVGAHLVEARWTASLTGGEIGSLRAAPVTGESMGVFEGRWRGFLRTVLTPTYGGDRRITLLLLAMLGGVVLAALAARRETVRPELVVAFMALAAGAGALALVLSPNTVIPGLLVAFPLAGAGFVLLRRSMLRTAAAQLCIGVFAVFAGCVIASQYAVGGSTEWGGRFFAMGLPLLVPVIVLAVKTQLVRLDRRSARWFAGGLLVCSMVTVTLAVTSIRHQHRRLGQLVTMAEDAGRSTGPQPVMVATYGSVPRWAWRTYDDQRWLVTAPDELDDLLGRLGNAGVERIVLVTPGLTRDRARLGTAEIVSSQASSLARGWHILVVAIR